MDSDGKEKAEGDPYSRTVTRPLGSKAEWEAQERKKIQREIKEVETPLREMKGLIIEGKPWETEEKDALEELAKKREKEPLEKAGRVKVGKEEETRDIRKERREIEAGQAESKK